jgi:PAS domain S-box-containing protein
MNKADLAKQFLDQNENLIWMIDLDFRLTYANKAYQNFMKEVTGNEKELHQLAFVDDFGETDVEKWRSYYKRALTGEFFEIEEHFHHSNTREAQYNQTSFKPIYDDDNKVCAVACESRDIAQFVEKRYESNELIDASLDVFCSIDDQGRFIHVSAASKELWGYSPEELKGMKYIDLTLKEDVAKTAEIAAEVLEGKKTRSFENRYWKKDGSIAFNLWSARWDPRVKIMYCVARDAKEKREKEELLLQSEKRFKALVQEGADLIGILDEEGVYKYVSPTSEGVLGFSPEELVGRSAFDFIHPEDAERVAECLRKLETTNRVKIEAFRFRNHKNEWRWIETILTNMLDNTAVNGIVANSRDITKERNLRKSSKQASQLAKVGSWEYDMVKDKMFWSDEVHELHETNPESFVPTVSRAIEFYKEEYKSFVEEAVQKSISEGVYLDYEAVIISKSKKEKWLRVIGSPEFSEGICIKFIGSFQDITDRKEAESRLQSLADNLPGVAFQYVMYPDGKDELKYVSKGSDKVWGYSAKQAIENNQLIWDQMKAGGDFDQVNASIQSSVENKEQWNARWNYVMPSGEIKTHIGYGSPKILADGSVNFNSLILDVTDQVDTERSFEQAISLSKVGTWEYEVANSNLILSDMVHEIFETDPLTFSPDMETAINFFREDFREEAHEKLIHLIRTGEPQNFEAILVSAKNNERWVQVKGDAVFIKGQSVKVYGSFQDIHNSKSLEIEIREVLRSISDPFQVIDVNWNFKYYNKEAEQLLKKSEEEVIGQNIWEVFPEKIDTPLEKIYRRVAQTGKPDSIEYLFSEDNNWYEVNVYPFQGGVSTFFRNVNDRKQTEEKLNHLNESLKEYALELERSNKELEQFAYITSHDMQEPLRMISSFMDQLKRKYGDDLDEKALEYISFATDGAKRMKQIILDLLEYSRASRPEGDADRVDLNEVLSEYKQLRRKVLDEKSVSIVSDQLPVLKTHKAVIVQIFHGILDNAIKYTKEDLTPVIEIRVKQHVNDWIFSIKDNGIGIAPEFFDKIFEIFQRLHNREEYQGTGIGLSIAKRSIEFLGGKVWLDSELGVGTTFFFTVPKINLND